MSVFVSFFFFLSLSFFFDVVDMSLTDDNDDTLPELGIGLLWILFRAPPPAGVDCLLFGVVVRCFLSCRRSRL